MAWWLCKLFMVAHIILAIDQEEKSCNPDINAPYVKLTILTTIPSLNESLHYHFNEVFLALGENARNKYVESIVVLIDNDTHERVQTIDMKNVWFEPEISSLLRQHISDIQKKNVDKIDNIATEIELNKIEGRIFGRQPTYADLFRYANYALLYNDDTSTILTTSKKIISIQNADVVLRNLHLLDESAFTQREEKQLPPLALVLTVRWPTGKYFVWCRKRQHLLPKDRCVNWKDAGKSFDGFIFQIPFDFPKMKFYYLEVAKPRYVFANMNGAENRVKQFLSASGWTLLNPCLNYLAEHWHCVRQQTHHVGTDDRKGVYPTEISDTLSRIVPVDKDTIGLRCSSNVSIT
uniref:Hexosyltransferase n=1 Tax=Aureoumbra lagunensis TaxID=44058 RepID=A0A6S8BBN0_9STRA|mmetsp:Transcript_4951/g.6099  ORF Transcript_4951/g.6099 Transcript_4951/m.6099 type:complete len:349 (+) Transcript_4951:322-1368(+)